jgi:hypothetical protein
MTALTGEAILIEVVVKWGGQMREGVVAMFLYRSRRRKKEISDERACVSWVLCDDGERS